MELLCRCLRTTSSQSSGVVTAGSGHCNVRASCCSNVVSAGSLFPPAARWDISCVDMVQTERYGYQSGCPNSCAGSLGMRCISRDRMRKSFITHATQPGIMPKSSPHTSIRVDCVSCGSLFIACSRQNSLWR